MQTFPILIEIPQGTVNNKFEFDHKTGKMVLDFVFHDLVWPFNYGEVVGTLGGDGDALDAAVFSTSPLKQGSRIECVPFGVMLSLDRGEVDDKLLMTPAADPLAQKYRDIADFNENMRKMITELYGKIAEQKNKKIIIKSFEGKNTALEILNKSTASPS